MIFATGQMFEKTMKIRYDCVMIFFYFKVFGMTIMLIVWK